MIATLTGTVAEKLGDLVVLDVHGTGYGLLVPVEDYGNLVIGEVAKVYIHEHIRETAYDLYGFYKLDTKHLFEQLLDVNGVGPKMTLNVLSIGTVDSVRSAIAAGDTKYIQAAPGVGKRVAERIVVELKDKVGLVSTASPETYLTSTNTLQQDEAVQALISLGYDVSDAVNALAHIDAQLPVEQRIREALKGTRS